MVWWGVAEGTGRAIICRSSAARSKQSRPFGARSTDAGAGADADAGAGADATLQFYLLCLLCVSDDSNGRENFGAARVEMPAVLSIHDSRFKMLINYILQIGVNSLNRFVYILQVPTMHTLHR